MGIKQYTKEEALKIVQTCAEHYKNHLLDRSLLFILMDKHKRISTLEVSFVKRNFLHLTGLVVDKTKLPGDRFFDLCIDKKLSVSNFELSQDGTTNLKLAVLPLLITKNLSANSVGEYNGTGIKLYTEKIAGSSKGCIGFVLDKSTGFMLPNTVLNIDIRDCSKYPQSRIIATYRKKLQEDTYTEIVHSARDINFDTVVFPEAYDYLPKPNRQALVKNKT